MNLDDHWKKAIQSVQTLYGTRPFFIYDLDAFAAHLKTITVPGVRFWYATKANPLSHVLRKVVSANFGVDCASAGEFRQAIRSGAKPENILLTGPAKSLELIREALAAGIRIFVLESLAQAIMLDAEAKIFKVKVRGLLRLQLHWPDGGESVLGGSEITAFGLDHDSWLALKNHALENVEMIGVHCFQWGNVLEVNRLNEIWQEIARQAIRLAQALGFSLRVLDLGGGLGIPYAEEASLDFSDLQTKMRELKKLIPNAEIWLELGRFAIGPYGKYVSQVLDRKSTFNTDILVLEGGAHHLVRPALVKQAFPASCLPGPTGQGVRQGGDEIKTSFAVHGPLCTSLDFLGKFDLNGSVCAGDSVVLHQCGAYGFTESMPYFLCHDLPAEFILKDDKITCARTWLKPESWLV